MIKINELYWLAGLIEGEGCFSISTIKGTPRLVFIMNSTEKKVLEHAQKIVNIGVIHGPYIRKNGLSKKPQWVWRTSKDSDVVGLMMTLYPLLWDNRQERIEDLLEIWKTLPKVKRHERS